MSDAVDIAIAKRDREIGLLVDVITALLQDIEPDPARIWIRGSSVARARAVLEKYREPE